jgi:regulator of protease activity HflC (stomatin/prohibitin superfamily)
MSNEAFNRMRGTGSAGRTIVVGALVLLAIFAVMLSWYVVPEGYRGVITRNQAVIGEAEPGLGFKLPFFDDVTNMSVQTERYRFENVVSYSRDIQQSASIVNVIVRLAPDSVAGMYSTVGVTYAEKLIYPALFRRFKEVFGRYAAAEIVNQRETVGQAILTALVSDLGGRGLIVEAVQIENIDFSSSYEQAVEAAAKAEADVKRARQELEQVKVDAQRQIAEAEAKATATRTTADAEAYATRTRGEAEAAAIAARGKALRDNPDLVSLITAEKWNGVLPATMLPGSAVPFVNVAPAKSAATP